MANTSSFHVDNYTPAITTVQMILTVYFPPIIVFTGSIGNWILLCLIRMPAFRSRYSYYMSWLAITNLLYLKLILFWDWFFVITTKNPIENISDTTCSIKKFVSNVIYHSRIWFVVVMATEQYLKIRDNKARTPDSVIANLLSHKTLTSLFIFIFLGITSIHIFWLYAKTSECVLMFEDNNIFPVIWQWVSIAVYSALPTCLLFVIVIMAMWKLRYQPTQTVNNQVRAEMQDDQESKTTQTALLTSRNKDETEAPTMIHTSLATAVMEILSGLLHTVTYVITVTYPPSWLQTGVLLDLLHYLQMSTTLVNWLCPAALLALCFFSKKFQQEFFQITSNKFNLCKDSLSKRISLLVHGTKDETFGSVPRCDIEETPV